MLDALRIASTEIPTVREFRIGRRILHGARYEGLSAEDYPYVAVVSFENVDGLKTYLRHPKHDEVGRLFYALADNVLVYDYDTSSILDFDSVVPPGG